MKVYKKSFIPFKAIYTFGPDHVLMFHCAKLILNNTKWEDLMNLVETNNYVSFVKKVILFDQLLGRLHEWQD